MKQLSSKHLTATTPTLTVRWILATTLWVRLFALAPACGDSPAPLVALNFDDGFANSGTAGGMAEMKIYAEGEGPYLTPGPWGDCLDLTAASRFGGTLKEMTPAGSALMLTEPRLDALESFTVMLWLRPDANAAAVNARILNKDKSYEILYSAAKLTLLTAEGNTKHPYAFPASTSGVGKWTFLAAIVDAAANEARLYLGDRNSGLGPPSIQELKHAPAQSTSPLEVGNLHGIRPFKGWLDNIRIFDTVLTDDEIRETFDRDLERRPKAKLIYNTGVITTTKRRFQPSRAAIFFRTMSQSRLSKLKGFDMLRAFHVTHLLWVYGNGPEPIRKVHGMGIFYQGTLNGLAGFNEATPDRSALDDKTGRQRDLDGNKVVLPHMAKWTPEHPRWTGCHNSPAFREIFWREADELIKAGVDSLHVDDWMMSYTTARIGLGCFCPDCIAGFRAYLKDNVSADELAAIGVNDVAAFDYAAYLKQHEKISTAREYRSRFRRLAITPHFLDFQRRTIRDFYRDFRSHLDQVSPKKYIPVSVNNQFYGRGPNDSFRGYFTVDLLDFFAGEASRSMQTANHFVMPCKLAEAFGIPQVMMWKPGALAAGKAALATSYALGQWFRVPWDLYMDITPDGRPAPRFFGTVEDWGRFYDFIHSHPHLFNGYEAAASVGVLFNADASPYLSVWKACQELAERQIQFRLIPGASRLSRVPVRADALSAMRFVLQLSSTDAFCEEDQLVIQAARNSRRIRFVDAVDSLEDVLANEGGPSIRVEGPLNIYAFLRVKADAQRPSAVIHVVNWNMVSDGSGPDVFRNITLSLRAPRRWGDAPTVNYYQPGREDGLPIKPEPHRDYVRITLPELGTWGVIEIVSG